MAAVSKQYSVQYNLTVNATGAATAISSFKNEISTINETVAKVNESITSIKNVINQVSSTPFKLNIAEFESQLATMERAAKATATKISNALAAAFNGKGAKGNPYIKSLNGTSFLQAQIKQTKAEIAKLSDDLAKSTIIKTKQNAVTGAQSTTSTQDPKILAKLNQAKSYLQSLEDQYAKLTGSDQKTKANNFAKAANTTAKAINTVSTAATGIDRNGITAIKKMAEALKALNRAPREMRFKISASVTGLNKVSQMASAINTISTYTKSSEKAAKAAAKGGATANVPVVAPLPNTQKNIISEKAVQLPAIVVSNAATTESLNAVMANLRGQIKPIAIPITVASNINAAKAVRGTVEGLQNTVSTITTSIAGQKASGKKESNKNESVGGTKAVKRPGKYDVKKGDIIQIGKNGLLTWWDGTPIKFYHGTDNPKLKKATQLRPGFKHLNGDSAQWFGKGIYFTPDIEGAREYAGTGNILQTPLMMKRPYIMIGGSPMYDPAESKAFTDKLIKSGYDGIIHLNSLAGLSDKERQQLKRAPSKSQLKRMSAKDIELFKTDALREVVAFDERAIPGATSSSNNNSKKSAARGKNEGLLVKTRLDRTTIDGDIRAMLTNAQNILNSNPLKVRAKLAKKDINISALKEKAAPIKVKLDISQAQTQLKVLLNQIKAASPQTIRVSVAQRGTSGGAGRGAAATVVTGGGSGSNVMVGRTPSSGNRIISGAEANRLRNMNIQKARWYPLTGNTSLGANTPMLVDMAKGMGTMMAIGGAMSAVSNSIHQSFEYENIMETAKAILKNNSDSSSFDDDFKEMAGIVREVGVKTKFTAPEVAGAAKFLAMAGLDIQSINSAIKPVSNVALAGDLDLETTADKLTNIMTAFDMKSSQIGELSDMLVNTFTRSNTSMMQLAEASQYAAPVAAEYGMNVNEMLSLMGVMGNAGIQGSMAGTSLRMIMNNIIKPSKQQMRWWNEIGVERFNANGTPRSVTEILQEVARKVPEDQLIQPIAGMFRVTSQAAAAQIIKHLQDVDDISKSNLASAGVAQRIGLAKQNTVQGLMAQVKSMFTEGILRGVEANQDKIKDMLSTFRDFFADPKTIEGLGKLVELFMDMMKIMMQMTKVAVGLYKTFGPVLMMMWKLQLWLSMFGGIVKMFLGTFNGIMAVFSRAMAAFGISTGGATAAAAAGSGAIVTGGTSSKVKAATAAKNAANAKVAAANAAILASTSSAAKLESSIAKKQMQWYALSTISDRAARADANRPWKWNMAYTNPQAAANAMSTLPDRASMMASRERDIAMMQAQLAATNGQIARQQYMRTEAIRARAAERIAQRKVSEDVLKRAVMAGKITKGTAIGMNMSNKFMSAATWGMVGMGSFNLFGKVMSVTGLLAKLFGALVNPLTLATAGLTVFAVNAISKANRIKEEREQSQRADMETARQMKALYAKSFPMLDTGSKFEPVLLKDRTTPSISIKNTPNYAKDPRFEKYYNGQPLSYDASKNAYEMFYKPYYKALYGKDAPSYKDRTLKGVGLWGYEIVDMGELGLELSNKYTDQYKANVYNSNFGKMQKASEEVDAEARYYQAISRPYIAATESDTYKRAVSDIRNIAIELQKDREAGKKVDSSKYIARMYDVAKPYANYEQYEHASLADMTSGSLDYSHIFRTYETQKILFNSLNEIIGNFKDTYKESGDAIELFDKFDFVNTTIQDQLAALGKLVGMVPVMVKDTEGTMHKLYLGINENGVVDIQSFHETLNRMGIAFKDTAYNNTMLLIDMIESIRKVPEYAKHITKESYNNLLTYMNGGKSLFFNQKKDFWSNVANNSDLGANLGSKTLNKAVYGKSAYDVVMKGLEAAGFKDEEIQKNIIYDMEHQTGRYADKSFYTKDMLNRQMNYYYNLGRKTLINEEYSAAHGENTTIGEDVAGDEGGNGNGTGNKFNPFNTPTTSKSNDQQKYGNHYSRQAARPTQINITIGSLANFDKTFIAKNAEEREMVEAMENKMAEAISMLTSQLSSQLSIVAENASA